MKNIFKKILIASAIAVIIPVTALAAAFKINQVIDPVTNGLLYSSGSPTANLTATTGPSLSKLNVSGTTTLSGGIQMASGTSLFYGNTALIDSSGNLNATVLPLQDTAANLAGVVPLRGQMVYETDTKLSKVGDGSTATANLLPVGFWKGNATNIVYPGRLTTGTTTDMGFGFYGAHDAVGAVAQRWANGVPMDILASPVNLSGGNGDCAGYYDMSINAYTTDNWASIGGVGLGCFSLTNFHSYGVASIDASTYNYFAGYTGFGTTTPSNPLEVAGNAYVSGRLTAGNIVATGTLSVTGQTTLGNASSTNISASATTTTLGLKITGLVNKLLGTDAQGNVVGTTTSGAGTVTSVGFTAPTGFSVSGSPVTGAGTLALSFAAGYNLPLTASTTQWASAYASTSALNATSPIAYNSTNGTISVASGFTIPVTASTTDWNTSYLNRITSAVSPLSITSNQISLGTVGVANGGTGVATIPQGFVYAPGGTAALTSSSSPVVGTITATSTTATSSMVALQLTRLGVSGALLDGASSPGVNGYVLQTTGTGISWVATSTLGLGSGGGGSGTVNSGTASQIAFYSSTGTAVSGTSTIKLLNENVGVGTSTPTNKLEVAGNIYASGSITGGNVTATGTLNVTGQTTMVNASSTRLSVSSAAFLPDGSSAAPSLTFTGQTGTGFYRRTSGTIDLAINGGESLEFAGNSGCSPFCPQFKMASNGFFGWSSGNLSGSPDTAFARVSANVVKLYDTGTTLGTLLLAKIGVGTTSPTQALEVNGNGYISGNLTAANITATGTVAATSYTGSGSSLSGVLKTADFTAKGDILAGTGSGTYSALAVGSNGKVLIASSTATNGVAWAATSTLGITGGGGGATVSGTDGQILVKSGSNAVGSSTPSVTAINATSTTATSSFSGYVKIGDGTAPRGIFDVGKLTTVPTPSAGTGVTFLYDDPASEADYSDDGGTYTFEIVAYVNGAWSSGTGLTISGTDTLATFGHTMDIVVNWLPVSGASKYRVYIHDFQNTGCDFTCYYETGMNGENPATTTVIFGQSPRPENVVVPGTLPLTPNQYGPSLYAANDGIHANNFFADYLSATTASSTWYGDGSNLTGVMKNPANVGVDFGGQYVKNAYRIGIATSSNPNYRLDIANANSISSSIHWSKNGAAGGGYLMSAATGNSFWSTGAYHNGSQWIATDANPVIFGAGANNDGNFTVYTDSGKTLNSSFSPTERLRFDTSGNLTVTGTMKPSSGYKSADGSSGTSATVTYLKDLSTTCTMTIKNGIITAITGASCP